MAIERTAKRNSARQRTAKNKTTKQLAVVVFLAVGLGVAVMTQPKNESARSDAVESGITELTLNVVAEPIAREPSESMVVVRSLPSIPLSDFVQVDPFASAHAQSRNIDPDGAMVHAVYGSGPDAVALVGRAIVRVGEKLPDGRRVLSISPDAVEFSR